MSMKDKPKQDALAQVRAARHQISEQFDHDPRKLVAYYLDLQQKYKDRLVRPVEEKDQEKAA